MSIPKIIHQTWKDGPLPGHFQRYAKTWKENHPEWEYRLWRDSDLQWMRNREIFDKAALYVPSHAVGQFKSDLARYEILLNHGGFYCDLDTECLRPIDDVLFALEEWACMEDPHWVGQAYLAARPDHPVMRDLVESLKQHVADPALKGKWASYLSGPRYLTPIWQRHGCYTDPNTPDWYPISYTQVGRNVVAKPMSPSVFAVHWWGHTRELAAKGKKPEWPTATKAQEGSA